MPAHISSVTVLVRFVRSFSPMLFCAAMLLSLAFTGVCQTATVRGAITDEVTGEALPFVSVVLQGSNSGVSSDLDGQFELTGLTPGVVNLSFSSIGYKTVTRLEIEVTPARPAYLNVSMEPSAVAIEAAEVQAQSGRGEEEAPVSLRRIGTNEIKRNPGGGRDISKAIRSLPGVAAIPSFRNDIVIRGGAPNENRFYIDGIEIPNINHFATQGASGGPVGMVNVDLVEQVEFFSGAFPATRGNALSSVMEFGFKTARTDEWTTNAVVGTSDLGLTFEGPTGENSSLICSARRSYLQYLFEVLGLPFLPIYNDFQFKWVYQANPNERLTVLGIGAYDDFQLNLSVLEDTASEGYLDQVAILDALQVNKQWNYAMGVKYDRFTEDGRWTWVASRNMLSNRAYKHESNDETLPLTLDYASQEMENKLRLERRRYGAEGLKVTWGAQYEFARFNNRTYSQQYFFLEDSLVALDFESAFDMHEYGAFIQGSKPIWDNRAVLSGGIRVDGNEVNTAMANPLRQLSPRLALRWNLRPQLSFNANVGRYFQLPSMLILGYVEGGERVNAQAARYIMCDQVVAGFKYDLSERNTTFGLEAFHKKYKGGPVSRAAGIALANLGADFGVVGNEAVSFDGDGRAFGLEFLTQRRLYKGVYGLMAYTYVRSEYAFKGTYAPSAWDSRHIVSLTGGAKLKRDWEIGVRWLYSGGLPFTPYDVDVSMDREYWDSQGVAQLNYDALNSGRNAAFSQLDLRIDKKWFYEKWSLDLFLDVQNLFSQVPDAPPFLDVQRDPSTGVPIADPVNAGRYLPRYIDADAGSVLPAFGLIIEL
jgi:hypothetical protein